MPGSHSPVLPRPHDFSADGFNDWAFMTTHSWDEDPSGEWVLEIENTSDANNYGRAGLAQAPLLPPSEPGMRVGAPWTPSVPPALLSFGCFAVTCWGEAGAGHMGGDAVALGSVGSDASGSPHAGWPVPAPNQSCARALLHAGGSSRR